MNFLRKISAGANKLLALRAEHGPYRFLLRRWDRLSDIDLAINVLGTDYFRSDLQPVRLPIEQCGTILLIAPHQDDEAIGAGGSLLMAAEAGLEIHVLYLTDGAQDVPSYPLTESIRIRDAEALQVCRVLGAEVHKVGISNTCPRPSIDHLQQIARVIAEVKPRVLMAPWLLDSPPKHRLVSHLLWLTDLQFGLPDVELWGYQVHNVIYPNGYVDITHVADQKRELVEMFHSQNSYFQCYDHIAMGMNAWNSRLLPVEQGNVSRRYAELFFVLPMRELSELVEKFYLPSLDNTYRGDKEVIAGVQSLHRELGTSTRTNGKSRARGVTFGRY